MLHPRKTREMDCKITTKNSNTQIFGQKNEICLHIFTFLAKYLVFAQ